jgi:hypothetical protein
LGRFVVRAKARTYLRGNGKGRSRFPEGMTERKATAKATATAKAAAKVKEEADSQRE